MHATLVEKYSEIMDTISILNPDLARALTREMCAAT